MVFHHLNYQGGDLLTVQVVLNRMMNICTNDCNYLLTCNALGIGDCGRKHKVTVPNDLARDRLTKLNNGHLPVWGEMMAGGIGGASQVSREHWRSIARKAKNSHG